MSEYEELVKLVGVARGALKKEHGTAKSLMNTLRERVGVLLGVGVSSPTIKTADVVPRNITLGGKPDEAHYETALTVDLLVPNMEPPVTVRFPIKLVPRAPRTFDLIIGEQSFTVDFGTPSNYDSVASAMGASIAARLQYAIDRTAPADTLAPDVYG